MMLLRKRSLEKATWVEKKKVEERRENGGLR